MDFLSEFELSLITILMSHNDIIEINENKNDRLPDTIMIQITQLLVLYVLKIIKYKLINQEIALCKNVCLLLAVSSKRLESIYTNDSINNYVMILIQLYTSLNIPLNEEYFFRKIDIGKYKIIKSEDNQIHIKYVLINHIKMFFKNNLHYLLKNILNEFNKNNLSNEQYSFLIELIYYLFYKPSYKNVKYLSSVFELLMFTLNPQLKELKYTCLENSKKLIVHLINHYPMITFHHNTQKIAVGNQDGIIEIYDMTNGNNWRKIPAHKKEINALIFDNSGSYYSHGKMRSEFTDNIFKNCDFSKLQPLVDQAIERLKNNFDGMLSEILGEALVRGLTDSYSFRDRLSEIIDGKVHSIVRDMKNNNQI
jgi:hypothetical protein